MKRLFDRQIMVSYYQSFGYYLLLFLLKKIEHRLAYKEPTLCLISDHCAVYVNLSEEIYKYVV